MKVEKGTREEDKKKILEALQMYITKTGEHPTREQICRYVEKKTMSYWYTLFRILIKEHKIHLSYDGELYLTFH